eukprot:300027-Prorocentrum_minimum.AAC.2
MTLVSSLIRLFSGTKVVESVATVEGEFVTICPSDADLICVLGNGVCTIYEVELNYKHYEIVKRQVEFAEEFVPICHAWLPAWCYYIELLLRRAIDAASKGQCTSPLKDN